MASLIGGLVGGLLGAAVAAALRRELRDDPGPAAAVWAKYLGSGDATAARVPGLAVHLGYGALAGGVFVSLGLGLGGLIGGILWALVWAALLGVVAVGFWGMVVLGERPERASVAPLAAGHLAYGLVLGLAVGLLGGV